MRGERLGLRRGDALAISVLAFALVVPSACGGRSVQEHAPEDVGASGTVGAGGATVGAGGTSSGTGGATVGAGVTATGGSGALGGSGADGGTSGSCGYQPCGIATGGSLGVPECGNVQADPGEECDDGNTVGGDGCSPACRVERDFVCPQVGPCAAPACGDGVIELAEECDDGNTTHGDGCDETCKLQSGWSCPAAGEHCRPACGDGMLAGSEQCDDGNTQSYDGCSAACLNEEPCYPEGDSGGAGNTPEGGQRLQPAGTACPAKCGDGLVEGEELCDLGKANNDGAYGGCGPDCRFAAFCGDGIVNGPEECDDGKNRTGYSIERQVGCGPGCRVPGFCGDGFIDGNDGEQCDDGAKNGSGRCKQDCRFGLK